jgi:type IV secretion system protein VirB8
MRRKPDVDKLAEELTAVRDLIEGHENMQQLLDMAADEADRRALEKESSRRLAWRVAGAFGGLTIVAFVIAGGAVTTALRPGPPPEILVVDKSTGLVQPLISLKSFQMTPEEATIRRNVNTFVLASQGYSYEQADWHYYTSAAFLSPELRAKWAQEWEKTNPASPPNKYKKDRRIRPQIGAITVVRNGLGAVIGARASFTRTELLNDTLDGKPTEWILNIALHWVNQPTEERDRRINDLGMEITDWNTDRDLAPENPTMQTATAQRDVQQVPSPSMALVAPANLKQVTP